MDSPTMKAKLGKVSYKVANGICKPFRLDPSVLNIPCEDRICEEMALRPDLRVLEIGSRNVTGNNGRARYPNAAEYIGVDILAGENVDIVADIHELSNHFERNYFDVVHSSAVFEHLMFPWKAALEINKILKVGGKVLTKTHPVWPAHEMPWDFWRFPKNAFLTIFNEATGYKLIDSVETFPMRLIPRVSVAGTEKMYKMDVNGFVFAAAEKIADYDEERFKWDIVPSDISDTMYPKPKKD